MCLSSCRLLSGIFSFASSAGAVAAVFALAGAAGAGEGPKNDEVFSSNQRRFRYRGPRSCRSTSAGSIRARTSIATTWPIEAINPSTSSTSGSSTVTHQFTPGFVGARATIS